MIEFKVSLKMDTIDARSTYDKALSAATARISTIIENDAKTNHRYKSRTGNLTRATKVNRIKDQIRAFIDDTQAKYGKYIHSGFKQWAPDPFIDNAIKKNRDLIERIIIEELDKVYG